jgi:sugar phosphate isomerase/epimerase
MMKEEIKFSAALAAFGNPGDRFISHYKVDRPLSELFALASKAGLSAIDFVYGWDLRDDNVNEVKEYLDQYQLKCCAVLPNIFGVNPFEKGAISSRDPKVLNKAREEIQRVMAITKAIGGNLIDIWPGQDGFDYPFEDDYFRAWNTMIDLIRDVADYDPEIKVGLEYKLKEPRVHCYIATVCKTILLSQATGRNNVGVFLDTGHAILGYENVAESFALTKLFGDRLFGVHINDTRRDWDWDMNVGSVHLLDTMEWLYWVDKIGFEGFYTLDIWPARMDSLQAIQESIAWTKAMRNALMKIGNQQIESMIAEGNPAKTMGILREAIFS